MGKAYSLGDGRGHDCVRERREGEVVAPEVGGGDLLNLFDVVTVLLRGPLEVFRLEPILKV